MDEFASIEQMGNNKMYGRSTQQRGALSMAQAIKESLEETLDSFVMDPQVSARTVLEAGSTVVLVITDYDGVEYEVFTRQRVN